MNFSLPPSLTAHLKKLDTFIEEVINPLQASNDNQRFFDHRREHSRTDWDNQGLPRREWEDLLKETTKLADKAGFWRLALPEEFGGSLGKGEVGKGNLWMAVIRLHLARKGLGLFNDLQNEHSIVGNFPEILMIREFGTPEQKREFIPGRLGGTKSFTFGLTEPNHGSDATFMETRAVKEVRNGVEGWRIDGAKKWQTGMHNATDCILFTRTDGEDGQASGITCFFVPANTEGITIESYEWTFNMPTDHATVSFENVWVPSTSMLGKQEKGLSIAQAFVHENRIRQAASSLGAAQYCIEESIKYARSRKPFGKELASNQAITFPIVELHAQASMLELLILKTAWEMDGMEASDVEKLLSDKISVCNYYSNRLCTQAADRAMQVHGGAGYSRHKPFEHIYRHHRRYRITEGSEEIQMRKVAGYLFGYIGPRKAELSKL